MNSVIEGLLNDLLAAASENKKQADVAYKKGDIGLSGYYRGISEANQEIADKIIKSMPVYNRVLH
ncbi:glyoxalase [Bacillus cytotoxicus]